MPFSKPSIAILCPQRISAVAKRARDDLERNRKLPNTLQIFSDFQRCIALDVRSSIFDQQKRFHISGINAISFQYLPARFRLHGREPKDPDGIASDDELNPPRAEITHAIKNHDGIMVHKTTRRRKPSRRDRITVLFFSGSEKRKERFCSVDLVCRNLNG